MSGLRELATELRTSMVVRFVPEADTAEITGSDAVFRNY